MLDWDRNRLRFLAAQPHSAKRKANEELERLRKFYGKEYRASFLRYVEPTPIEAYIAANSPSP